MNEPIAEGWIGMAEAAELSGYSPAYVRQLANRGRVEARKVGRDWLIERGSLEAYKARMDELGAEKHNPWRGDLAEQGRGRRGDHFPGSVGGSRRGIFVGWEGAVSAARAPSCSFFWEARMLFDARHGARLLQSCSTRDSTCR